VPVVKRRVNTDEQWTDVRMSGLRVPDLGYRRPRRLGERVIGFAAIAAACYVHQRTLIAARDSDPNVRSLIRKVGGRYYVLARDLIELDLALHARRVNGRSTGARSRTRVGSGRFARRV
jgi:hypothetical protein